MTWLGAWKHFKMKYKFWITAKNTIHSSPPVTWLDYLTISRSSAASLLLDICGVVALRFCRQCAKRAESERMDWSWAPSSGCYGSICFPFVLTEEAVLSSCAQGCASSRASACEHLVLSVGLCGAREQREWTWCELWIRHHGVCVGSCVGSCEPTTPSRPPAVNARRPARYVTFFQADLANISAPGVVLSICWRTIVQRRSLEKDCQLVTQISKQLSDHLGYERRQSLWRNDFDISLFWLLSLRWGFSSGDYFKFDITLNMTRRPR